MHKCSNHKEQLPDILNNNFCISKMSHRNNSRRKNAQFVKMCSKSGKYISFSKKVSCEIIPQMLYYRII